MSLVRLALFGLPDRRRIDEIRLNAPIPTEATEFDVVVFDDDRDLLAKLAESRPHVIVTFGDIEWYRELVAAPMWVRKRWLHVPDADAPLDELAESAMFTFAANVVADRFPEAPLVSVFTCAYRSGDRLRRAYQSLVAQTYGDWEWVVYDDSDDDGETFRLISELAAKDPRIVAARSTGNCGRIGEVKRRACGLTRGELIVELDHDDRLLPRCLEYVVRASFDHPDAGFFYSDGTEVFENGENAHYVDGWGFGYGTYRTEVIDGVERLVQNYPPVNAKTIRHIVGAPNHVRAWTRLAYAACGGHNGDLHVCDDYDLCVRMFLTTPMVHIQECCYMQIYDVGESNTQRTRNAEIQRLTRYLMQHYNQAIHERFVELGVDDYTWRDGDLDWDAPSPEGEHHANRVWKATDEPLT